MGRRREMRELKVGDKVITKKHCPTLEKRLRNKRATIIAIQPGYPAQLVYMVKFEPGILWDGHYWPCYREEIKG